MSRSYSSHGLDENNLAIFFGHVAGLRTVAKLLYDELKKHDLAPDPGHFSDLAAEEIEEALSFTASKYPAFKRIPYRKNAMIYGTFHNEVLRVLQGEFDK